MAYEKERDLLVPKEDDLHLYWVMANHNGKQVKTYTVVCKCGHNKLLVAENGLRCQGCSAFHSHANFLRMKEKAKQASSFDDGKIEQLPQPFIEQWKMWHINRKKNLEEKAKKRIITPDEFKKETTKKPEIILPGHNV